MKKILITIFLIGLILPFTLSAQQVVDTWKGTDLESEFYAVDLMVYRVSPHPLGYRVEYYKPSGDLFAVYCPLSWFEKGSAGPAQIVWGDGQQYPYMSLYYKEGKIDHFRLYVKDNQYDTSWGTLERNNADYEEKFSGAFEDFKIEY